LKSKGKTYCIFDKKLNTAIAQSGNFSELKKLMEKLNNPNRYEIREIK